MNEWLWMCTARWIQWATFLTSFYFRKLAILPMMPWHSNSEIVNFNKRKSAYLNSWARLLLCYNLTHIIHEKEWEGMQISITCCCTQHPVHSSTHKAKPCNSLWQKFSSVLEEIQVFSNVRIIFFVSQSDLGALFSFIDKFSSRIYEDFLHMCTYSGEAHSRIH